MSVEQRQLKNLRNKIHDLIKKTTPESLIKFALYCKIKVPDELLRKYLGSKPE
jgi:hypothetical protein